MQLPPTDFSQVNLQEQAAKLRNIARASYHEAFSDSLSIFLSFMCTTLVFRNQRVFHILWNTFLNNFKLVNICFAYYLLLAMGLTFAKMSFNAGFDGSYLHFVLAFCQMLLPIQAPYKDSPGHQLVSYEFVTRHKFLLTVVYELLTFWILLILIGGLFLPMFSSEIQNSGIRGDTKDGNKNAKKRKL